MAPALLIPSRLRCPVFTRESISWRTVSPGLIEIAIEVENPESEPTTSGELVIETAALGAFVPFTPVTRIALGSIEPGGRRRVTTKVARQRLAAPPTMPLGTGAALAEVLRKGYPDLDPKIFDLMDRSEWAGNLNVYFDREPSRAVEVHRAFDLQVKAGGAVMLVVVLPSDRTQYSVDVRVSSLEWKAQVLDFFGAAFAFVESTARPGLRGTVTIEVTRKDDGLKVPVELSLETVAGESGTLGCVDV